MEAVCTGQDLMSLMHYGETDFPIQFSMDDFRQMQLGFINCHWHHQVEFSYVLEGEVLYSVSDTQVTLAEGEAIFINTERLHMSKPVEGCTGAKMLSVIFDPLVLAPGPHSAVYQKYIRPALLADEFPFVALQQREEYRPILQLFEELLAVYTGQPYGFEMISQNLLAQIWQRLFLQSGHCLPQGTGTDWLGQKRVKAMIAYIQANYAKPIALTQIAASANISKSECIRCFKKQLGATPVDFLLQYRISRAILLLKESSMPVHEIAYSCGFDSPSYFTKMFRRQIKMTPSDYRKTV